MDLVKFLPVHPYSVDIFSYSGPSGILGSGGKQNHNGIANILHVNTESGCKGTACLFQVKHAVGVMG